MARFKKAVSVILIFALLFSFNSFAVKEETEAENPQEYMQMLWEEGYDAISSDVIVAILQHIQNIVAHLAGKDGYERSFNLSLDSFSEDVFGYIAENSGFNIGEILCSLPDINVPANKIVDTLNIDTTSFREEMYNKKAQCEAEGNGSMAMVYHFLGVYFSIIEECFVYGEKTDNPDVYEVFIKFTYKDKSTETISPGIFVNTVTGECTNRDNSGIIGSGFNFSLSDMVLYATVDCWMRSFGFCVLYDVLANSMPTVYNYETKRFHFEYDSLSWMIQIWKGNYFVANGGEVGLYCRTPDKKGTFYECVDDSRMLPMTMEISHGDDVLVKKDREIHWWINGFNLSGKLYAPESLTMSFSIEMPDSEMLKAFTESMDKYDDVSYTAENLTVNVIW